MTVSGIRKAVYAGRIPSRRVPGKYGEQVLVPLDDVRQQLTGRARAVGQGTPSPADPSLQQALSALAELARQLAEASERAGRYEAEARLLREQLREAKRGRS